MHPANNNDKFGRLFNNAHSSALQNTTESFPIEQMLECLSLCSAQISLALSFYRCDSLVWCHFFCLFVICSLSFILKLIFLLLIFLLLSSSSSFRYFHGKTVRKSLYDCVWVCLCIRCRYWCVCELLIVLTFWSPYGRLLHKIARLCTFALTHTLEREKETRLHTSTTIHFIYIIFG